MTANLHREHIRGANEHVRRANEHVDLSFYLPLRFNTRCHGLRKLHRPISSGRGVTQLTGLYGLNPRNTGHGTTDRGADAALVQRLRQGERERDGQERADRVTASLKGTWPGKHRSGSRVERVDCTSHPAAAMGGAQ